MVSSSTADRTSAMQALVDTDLPPIPRLVQWCHGAPGFVITMVAAEAAFGGGSYLAAARKAAHVIWNRGLLRKGVGLCHGIRWMGDQRDGHLHY